MSIQAVLKEGHRHNTIKSVDTRIRNVNRQPSLGPAIQNSIPLKAGERIVLPDDAVVETGKTSATHNLNSYLCSPIRTLCESLNDPEHLYASNHES